MRFLPVFLDLQAGPVVLVGQGELAQAKLRLLLAADAREHGLEPSRVARSKALDLRDLQIWIFGVCLGF